MTGFERASEWDAAVRRLGTYVHSVIVVTDAVAALTS